jgi:uncharacterized membrane protein
MKTSQKIQLYKTVTWAVLSMTITAGIAWILTGSLGIAAAIGVVDRIIKMGVYYWHERHWHKKYKSEKKQILMERQLD